MKAKNSKQINKSFFKFILLFMAATIFIVVAVFFNTKIPTKENKELKAQAILVDREIEFQNEFGKSMAMVDNMLDSLDIKSEMRPYINDMITRNIGDMQRSVPKKNEIIQYEMYDRVVKKYAQIQALKKELYSLQESKKRIAEYKEALEESREENKQLQRDLDMLRASSAYRNR